MRGGLQMASDFMPQGDLLPIPLKRYIGYQRNTHVIVHFMQGTPDLGHWSQVKQIRKLSNPGKAEAAFPTTPEILP